mmetsp:Transcript_158084/g.507184  ORF Transcript_158084/g.507184 Transcript_158084/m.507184 type:complete len:145 (-) Transcript_158084:1433-1867(-)
MLGRTCSSAPSFAGTSSSWTWLARPATQLEQFNDRPIGPASPMLSTTPLAAGPLRAGRLRVEHGEAGAGLELSACPAGYLVERLLEWPGQPDLREGDAIVAIGGEFLHDLEEADLEERFRKHFADRAAVIVGNWESCRRPAGPQ